MNTSSPADAITNRYQVSATRMEIDKFIVPTVTIFIGLLLCFFMLFPLSAILKLSFFKGGEFGLMAVLMLHNRMPAIIANQRRCRWDSLYSTPVSGKTLLVIGVGNIGAAAARHCRALGLRVLGVSRHGRAVADLAAHSGPQRGALHSRSRGGRSRQ